ncbi:hypothetical protein GPJ56_001739 [Histomonas meleagridis]|uniref:uncharacterized protein n=1 Tax=Histomonas meleagridis TaxID=135588 RepID=UPI00355A5B89|nr:hypothetical protein GPJ56_001739 [Histomonas meleagridis]KAH0796176.1 hypothetical protein GO595_010069 [Histomonas meleagridis]
MKKSLKDRFEEFQEETNQKLDQIEAEINSYSKALGISSESSVKSTSSICSDIGPPSEIDWDVFSIKVQADPDAAITEIITYLRSALAQKASSRSIIEKANCKYVDSTFQRVSTQLTAYVNQKVLNNHNQLMSEINNTIHEIDLLKEHMTHEFAEIHALINECFQEKERIQRESDLNPNYLYYHERQRHIINRNLVQNTMRRYSGPLLRDRKDIKKEAKSLSFTLTPSKLQ